MTGDLVTPGAAYSTDPNPTGRPNQRRMVVWGIIATGFLIAWLVLAYLLGADNGIQVTLMAAVFAALPLLVVVPTFLWMDRLEAEPWRYLAFAYLWGALCAAAGSMFLNTGVHFLLLLSRAPDADSLAAVLSAPPVEEGLKGLGVLLILLFRRREFDGVIDGVVYAGLAGAGFAFTENLFYLSRAYEAGGSEAFAYVFFLRCITGPFAHPLFTACIGIGLGLAASVARTRGAKIGFGLAGFVAAMLLHGIWNLSASLGGYWKTYFAFQVPIFIGFVVLVVMLRSREGTLIRRYLSQYADAGWLTPNEVAMLATMATRRAARTWAKSTGGQPALRSMRAFQDSASDLALLRSRMVRGAAEPEAPARERELLEAITAHRAAFVPRYAAA
ncbi:MAG TPA: PrsW family intramembrane metalloprotease [Dermatophilaceae bacterium]|nr:PrsW family intramembrane metalloprotease [Dermatophilaceae bacterium]